MYMNYGIIDLGSNSLRLEIFKYDNNQYIFKKKLVGSYLLPEGIYRY